MFMDMVESREQNEFELSVFDIDEFALMDDDERAKVLEDADLDFYNFDS